MYNHNHDVRYQGYYMAQCACAVRQSNVINFNLRDNCAMTNVNASRATLIHYAHECTRRFEKTTANEGLTPLLLLRMTGDGLL